MTRQAVQAKGQQKFGRSDDQIDCEMTGLNALEDKIIEIAVIITNGHLEPVDEGIEFIIKTDKSILDK